MEKAKKQALAEKKKKEEAEKLKKRKKHRVEKKDIKENLKDLEVIKRNIDKISRIWYKKSIYSHRRRIIVLYARNMFSLFTFG